MPSNTQDHKYPVSDDTQNLILQVILKLMKDDRMSGEPLQSLVELTEDLERATKDEVTVTTNLSHAALYAVMELIKDQILNIEEKDNG